VARGRSYFYGQRGKSISEFIKTIEAIGSFSLEIGGKSKGFSELALFDKGKEVHEI
jgi:hypothetical protein